MPTLHAPKLQTVEHYADRNHYWPGPRQRPVFIGLHATAGRRSLDWLTTEPSSEASAHFLVPKDGPVYRLVRDEDSAWTNGPSTVYVQPGLRPNPNIGALTIEVENLNDGKDPYTYGQVERTARICVGWWAKYGYLPIIRHWLIQRDKTDPKGWPDGWFSATLMQLAHDNWY